MFRSNHGSKICCEGHQYSLYSPIWQHSARYNDLHPNQLLWCLGRQMHAPGLPRSSRKCTMRRYKMWITEMSRTVLRAPFHSTLTQKHIMMLGRHTPHKGQHSPCFCCVEYGEMCSFCRWAYISWQWGQEKRASFLSFLFSLHPFFKKISHLDSKIISLPHISLLHPFNKPSL